ADAGVDRQQVQVMVAEHGGGARTESAHHAQRLERGGAPVDEIAGEPERFVGRQAFEQFAQAGGAALYVTDRDHRVLVTPANPRTIRSLLRPTAGWSRPGAA